jgi:hypothetical protein
MRDELLPAELPSRRAFDRKGDAWWYVGRTACHFHREGGSMTVRTSAIRRALAALDRQVKSKKARTP